MSNDGLGQAGEDQASPDASVTCAKCARVWQPDSEQALCIDRHGECIPCRFLPSGEKNPHGSGAGTTDEFEALGSSAAATSGEDVAAADAQVRIEDIEMFAAQLLQYGRIILMLAERVDKLEQRERESQTRWVLHNATKPATARDN